MTKVLILFCFNYKKQLIIKMNNNDYFIITNISSSVYSHTDIKNIYHKR